MAEEGKSAGRDRFDPRIIVIALILGILEFEIFTIPQGIIEMAERDAWLSILLGSVIINIITFFLVKLALRFPGKNLHHYTVKVLGKPIGLITSLLYILFWAVVLVMLTQNVTIVNRTLFLKETPMLMTSLLLLIGVLGIVPYGLAAVLRLYQLLLPFFIIPVFIIVILSVTSIRAEFFSPVLAGGFLPVVKGALLYISRFQGIELLFFLFPFISTTKGAMKYALLGINSVNILMFAMTFISIGVLGVENLKQSVWSAIHVISVIEIPGFPGERFDLFLTISWLIAIYTTLCLLFYLVSFSIIQVFRIKRHRPVYYMLAVLIIAGTYLIPNYAWTVYLRNITSYLTYLFSFLIPLVILVMAAVKGKRGAKQ